MGGSRGRSWEWGRKLTHHPAPSFVPVATLWSHVKREAERKGFLGLKSGTAAE
jgi:hypothetical protein